MKDFILAAFPWIIIGISVAIIVVNNNKVKTKKHQKKLILVKGYV